MVCRPGGVSARRSSRACGRSATAAGRRRIGRGRRSSPSAGPQVRAVGRPRPRRATRPRQASLLDDSLPGERASRSMNSLDEVGEQTRQYSVRRQRPQRPQSSLEPVEFGRRERTGQGAPGHQRHGQRRSSGELQRCRHEIGRLCRDRPQRGPLPKMLVAVGGHIALGDDRPFDPHLMCLRHRPTVARKSSAEGVNFGSAPSTSG